MWKKCGWCRYDFFGPRHFMGEPAVQTSVYPAHCWQVLNERGTNWHQDGAPEVLALNGFVRWALTNRPTVCFKGHIEANNNWMWWMGNIDRPKRHFITCQIPVPGLPVCGVAGKKSQDASAPAEPCEGRSQAWLRKSVAYPPLTGSAQILKTRVTIDPSPPSQPWR